MGKQMSVTVTRKNDRVIRVSVEVWANSFAQARRRLAEAIDRVRDQEAAERTGAALEEPTC